MNDKTGTSDPEIYGLIREFNSVIRGLLEVLRGHQEMHASAQRVLQAQQQVVLTLAREAGCEVDVPEEPEAPTPDSIEKAERGLRELENLFKSDEERISGGGHASGDSGQS